MASRIVLGLLLLFASVWGFGLPLSAGDTYPDIKARQWFINDGKTTIDEFLSMDRVVVLCSMRSIGDNDSIYQDLVRFKKLFALLDLPGKVLPIVIINSYKVPSDDFQAHLQAWGITDPFLFPHPESNRELSMVGTDYSYFIGPDRKVIASILKLGLDIQSLVALRALLADEKPVPSSNPVSAEAVIAALDAAADNKGFLGNEGLVAETAGALIEGIVQHASDRDVQKKGIQLASDMIKKGKSNYIVCSGLRLAAAFGRNAKAGNLVMAVLNRELNQRDINPDLLNAALDALAATARYEEGGAALLLTALSGKVKRDNATLVLYVKALSRMRHVKAVEGLVSLIKRQWAGGVGGYVFSGVSEMPKDQPPSDDEIFNAELGCALYKMTSFNGAGGSEPLADEALEATSVAKLNAWFNKNKAALARNYKLEEAGMK